MGVPAKDILSVSYNARGKSFLDVCEQVDHQVDERMDALDLNYVDVEFAGIGHSLGGLILRNLDLSLFYKFQQIVQLGSPNEGVNWVDDLPLGRKAAALMFGSTIIESLESPCLQTHLQEYDKGKAAACPNMTTMYTTKQFSFWNPLSWYANLGLTGPHDGFVPVASMYLAGAEGVQTYCDHLGVIADLETIQFTCKKVMS